MLFIVLVGIELSLAFDVDTDPCIGALNGKRGNEKRGAPAACERGRLSQWLAIRGSILPARNDLIPALAC